MKFYCQPAPEFDCFEFGSVESKGAVVFDSVFLVYGFLTVSLRYLKIFEKTTTFTINEMIVLVLINHES